MDVRPGGSTGPGGHGRFPIVAAYGTGSGTGVARSLERLVVGGVNRFTLDNNSSAASETTVDFSGVHAVYGDFGASTMQPRIDGVDGAQVTGLTVATATNRIRIGAFCGTTAALFMTGVVGHVLIGPGALSTADKLRLDAWALWSCGKQDLLPASSPYRNRRP
jgi:hypothetical protein